jgi:probable phosphoglycerate mutase
LLNEWGEAQAAAFFNAYQHVPFDKIYTSDLKRTQQTVRGFIKRGIPHESYSGLNEISWGAREGREPNTGDNNYYRELVNAWKNGQVDLAAEEGESPVQVRERQIPVIETILSRPHERNILIAMHGRAMRVLLTTLFDQPLVRMDDYEQQPLSLQNQLLLRYPAVRAGSVQRHYTPSFHRNPANDIAAVCVYSFPLVY